jgi:lysophospholipase L1-like esterase
VPLLLDLTKTLMPPLVTSITPPASLTPLASITPSPEPTETATPSGPQTISAAHPSISYIGRFNFSDPEAPTFDWPGVAIEAAFTGPALTLLLEDGNNLYNLYLDGVETLLWTYAEQTEYPMAADLGPGTHVLRLVKRTEFNGAVGTFHGLYLPEGGSTQPAPARPSRRIEFIGDSITAGYGVEGDSPTCPYSALTQNIEQTFAAMIGRELNAEVMTTAMSGIGVIRNYQEPDMISAEPMSVRYERALADDAAFPWDFSRWKPDLIVITLGTNDFSTTPRPSQPIFVQAYIDLLNTIRGRFPFTPILAVVPPILPGPATSYIETAVAHLNQNQHDPNVHYLAPQANLVLATDYGCDYHPNVSGQQKIADQLLPTIRELMGW